MCDFLFCLVQLVIAQFLFYSVNILTCDKRLLTYLLIYLLTY